MPATVTVTGVVGAGQAVTAGVFTNVVSFEVDTVGNLLTFRQSTVNTPTCVSINAATTITATKSGSTYTLTIS